MPDNKALIQEVKAFIRDQDRMLNEKPDRMATDDEKEEVAEYLASVMPDIKAYQDKLKLADDLSRGMFDTIQSYLGSFFITEDWSDVDVLADDELESLSVQLLGLQQRITDTFSNKEDVKLQEEEVEEIQEVVEPEKPNPELEASNAENARLRTQMQEQQKQIQRQQAEIERLRAQLQASQKPPSPQTITRGIDSGSDNDSVSSDTDTPRKETKEALLQRIGAKPTAMTSLLGGLGAGLGNLKKFKEDAVDVAIKRAKGEPGVDLVAVALEAAEKDKSDQVVAVGKAAKASEGVSDTDIMHTVIDFIKEKEPNISANNLKTKVLDIASKINLSPITAEVMVKQEVKGIRTRGGDVAEQQKLKSQVQEVRASQEQGTDLSKDNEEDLGNPTLS